MHRLALRAWIGGTSFLSFLVGLAMLAHSPKPVQPNGGTVQYQTLDVPPLKTPEPLPPLDLSGYLQGGAVQVQEFTVQLLPTAVPQQPSILPPQSNTVQQPATGNRKKAKAAEQRAGDSSSPPVVNTGGS